nr:MAG TPA: hypothetical protein [Caudoviricetes sp.]
MSRTGNFYCPHLITNRNGRQPHFMAIRLRQAK